ncbi:protease complex subunit PrcB family protein [Flavobacterium jumunjinense]|uniref:Protease complex subunit PrcB family protein n=2 Tax=Flavobacteriaceae TaxID=49546 RepID=A0ABV5GSM0_9FLAO
MDNEFKTIYVSGYGGDESKGHQIISSYDDLKQEFARLNVPSEVIDNSNIDFKDNVILIAHLGEKNTGGYGIDVEKIEFEEETLIIQTKLSVPEKGGNVTMAITNPFCITIIPKAKKYSVK